MKSKETLWQQTPLVRSSALSDRTGCEVYLKIETFQTSGSFKGRGVSHFANCSLRSYINGTEPDTKRSAIEATEENMHEWSRPVDVSAIPPERRPHLVIASGGNAGLAAASAARILGVPITIFVPEEQAKIVHMFERHNAHGGVEVRVGGENYAAAAKAAKEFADGLGDRGILVPAYDDPLVWQGNSTIVHEMAQQLPANVKPDAIFCSVGGAGLISGIILGCEGIASWENVPIVGLEPRGSACFYHSVLRTRGIEGIAPDDATFTEVLVPDPIHGLVAQRRNQPEVSRVQLVKLGHIASRATSLGASSPCTGAIAMALQRRGPVHCITASDEHAMSAALRFADDHCVVSEIACSLTLVPAYTPRLLDHLVPMSQAEDGQTPRKRVLVFIVCGGSKGSYHDLCKFEDELKGWNIDKDAICVDGGFLMTNQIQSQGLCY